MIIKLLSTINSDYQAPLEALACSLVQNKHNATAIQWHILTEFLDSDWQSWLSRMNHQFKNQRTTFKIHQLQGLPSRDLPLRGKARKIMYARLVAPNQLQNQAEKLLYLDADMLVLQPIEDLWNINLKDHVCACCQDLAIPYVSSPMAIQDPNALGLPFDAPYFNAGVMLIDTKKWHERNIASKALAYLERNAANINLYDQEALNAALQGDWLQLSFRWNVIASIAGRSFLKPIITESEDYRHSIDRPCIVHFAGTLKPWLNPFLRGHWFDLYRSSLKRAIPTHKFRPKILHWLQASYNGTVRNWVYPIEHRIWQLMRGF